MKSKSVLILGATSSIARAAADAFAEKGYALYLAGRNTQELQRLATDISIRHGTKVRHGTFDAEDTGTHRDFLQNVISSTGNLEGILLAFGDLGEHDRAIHNFDAAQTIINRNFTGACSILTHCANYLSAEKRGFIIAVSSVAGDRGRQSNYIYGAAKGGLSLFIQGLRNRLHPYGVRVITVKPGFVDTPMTFGKPGLFLVANPQKVGKKIVEILDTKRDIVYIPGFWKYIMLITKAIPERLFKENEIMTKASSKPILAVFDFDGTITTRDSLLSFLFYVAGQWTTLSANWRRYPLPCWPFYLNAFHGRKQKKYL